MSDAFALDLGGERLLARSDRTLWWPRRRTLLVADPHFGKGQVLRDAGIPLPRGATTEGLARLGAAVDATGAERLVVLGDLVHGPTADAAPYIERVRAWCAARPALERLVVPGNHDRHRAPADLGFTAAPRPLRMDGFALLHEPAEVAGCYALAGHLHPGIALRDLGRRLRLPAFWIGRTLAILPAFGRLTGLAPLRPRAGDRVLAVAGDAVIEIPRRAPRSAKR